MKKFEVGQDVYDEHGSTYTYIAQNSGEHIVREVLEDSESGEPYEGDVRTLRNVFASPESGRQKLDARLSALQEKIAAAELELHDVQGAIHAANKEVQARADRLKQHEQLAFLDDYLQGKITHYVEVPEYGGGCAIISVTDVSDIERRDRKFRLLTLSGGTDYRGGIHWQLNHYSDGSGWNKAVQPCRSLEEAQEKARQILEAQIAELMTKPAGNRVHTGHLFQCCEKHGVSVPQVLVDELNVTLNQAAITRRKQLQAEIEQIDAKLALSSL